MKFGYAASLILLLNLASLGAEGQAQVQVHVVDAYGNPVPAQKITLTGEDGTTTEAKQDELFSEKYGRYTVKVRVPGFSNAVEVFVVDQPRQILSVAMKLGMMEAPRPLCSITGRVTPENAAVRIRLLQLFGSYSADVPVIAGGSFRFQNLECGDYMLIAMGPKGCVATKMSRSTTTGTQADMQVSLLGGDACVPTK
jgi:hypothetical protein